MTISTTTNRVVYNGDGVATAFSFPYLFRANAELVVIETDTTTKAETTKTITTHYTVTGAGVSTGGTVTAVTAPASGKKWTIYRDTSRTQTLDLLANSRLDAGSLEAILDDIVCQIQRLNDQMSRAVRLTDGHVDGLETRLPVPLVASYVLALNSGKTAFEWVAAGSGGGGGAGTVVVQLSDSTVEAAATTIDFQTGFTVTSSPSGEANVGLDVVNANVNASAAIALSKLATIATDRLLGRVSASTGAIEEIPITDFVQTILDDADAATVRATIGAAASGAAPTAHAASHSNGSSDPITITNLAGFPGGTTTYLRADGTFGTPAATGGTVVVQLSDSTVDAAAATIDFGSGFSVTSSPAGEANVGLDIVNANVNASAAIAQSKLSLSITNAEVNASAAIVWSKLANVSATDKLLGRSTAGAGVIEEITCTSFARSILDDTNAATVLTTIGAPSIDHDLTHLPGGTDELQWSSSIHMRGTTAARPAASTTNAGLFYSLSDGTGALQRAAGASWIDIAPPYLHASQHSSGGADPITVTNLAGFPGGTTNYLRADGTFASPSAGSTITVQLSDSTVDASTGTIDFGSGFTCTSSPAGEANVGLDIVNANVNASAAIAWSKLANVSATDKLLGRSTAGAGVIEEITCTSAARSLLDDTTAAAMLVTLGAGTGNLSGGYVTRSGTNLIFLPDKSNRVWLYESSVWTQKTIPDAGITAACTSLGSASTVYYLYVYDNAGTLTLDLSTTGTTTQNGIKVKSGATSRLLIAVCYSDSGSAIKSVNEDASLHNICNVFNKRTVTVYKLDTTSSWTYNSATWRSGNGSSANKVQFVSDGSVAVRATVHCDGLAAGSSYPFVGVGFDSTTVNSAISGFVSRTSTNAAYSVADYFANAVASGMHDLNWIESAMNTSTVTYYSDTAFDASGFVPMGIVATLMGV